jgi:hypothetical protein
MMLYEEAPSVIMVKKLNILKSRTLTRTINKVVVRSAR